MYEQLTIKKREKKGIMVVGHQAGKGRRVGEDIICIFSHRS